MAVLTPCRVTGAMADLAGTCPSWRWRRGPDLRAFLIAQIDGFARRIGDWIVRPGGKAILPAVERPCEAPSRLGDDATEPSFASTLHQGAGVCSPGSRWMTYSRPSSVKPPRPLAKSRSVGRESVDAA